MIRRRLLGAAGALALLAVTGGFGTAGLTARAEAKAACACCGDACACATCTCAADRSCCSACDCPGCGAGACCTAG